MVFTRLARAEGYRLWQWVDILATFRCLQGAAAVEWSAKGTRAAHVRSSPAGRLRRTKMAEHTNRTFICSVLFLDIVEYSQRSVAEQIALKERFNAVLTEAIAGVATDDRIILDTGDGAAVSFLGDPEDALFAGMSLRDAVPGQQELASGGPRLQVRVGVNLGPVRLVKDINGQPNIIGDGINVAQRVMSFAEPGQILVSRSYYDVMARLSEDYAKLFHYEG